MPKLLLHMNADGAIDTREAPRGRPKRNERDPRRIRHTSLAFAPGEKWQYSNLSYFVLAKIISRAAQIPWPDYLPIRASCSVQ